MQSKGHVVGFLGDGINDSPALRTADVGISVDSAVDIAKEAADIILLEKSLMVLEEGVLEGRKVFANILKYVRMGASSNFGNMFSVLGASAFVPFLPMAPIQILTNNLLYDFSQVPIPGRRRRPRADRQAASLADGRDRPLHPLHRPVQFDLRLHDLLDDALPVRLLGRSTPKRHTASLFQTGWFVESLLTQTLIIHVIRTNRIPFLQSRASWPLIVTTAIIMAVGVWLPSSPIGSWLGFTPLPGLYWPLLALTLLCYVVLTQGGEDVADPQGVDLIHVARYFVRRSMMRLSATEQPSPLAWTISGLMSHSEISGWLQTMAESRNSVSTMARDVGGRIAAEAVEHLEGANLPHHPLGRSLPHRRQAERHVLEHLDQRAAQAEHHQRSEPRVAAGAEDHFHALAGHLLDENPLDLRAGNVLLHVAEDLLVGRAGLVAAVDVEDHSAGVVLVDHVGRHHLHHHRRAERLGRPRRPRRRCGPRRSSTAAGGSRPAAGGSRPA